MKVNKELNHSVSHLLAAAVIKLYPFVQLGFGPAIDEGFYYDFKFQKPISDKDLLAIEKEMKRIQKRGYLIQKMPTNFEFDYTVAPFKKELFNEFTKDKKSITYYGMINPFNKKSIFTDLCAGGHIDKVSQIKNFKLLSIAGAYWRGNSNNEQLTRIYGTAWKTNVELEDYLHLIQERKERDHRKLGKELNIFTFNSLAGQGFPIWLEDGMKLRNKIMKEILRLDQKYGFDEVETPALGEKKLYEISGHWAHYQDAMFKPIEVDSEKLVLRPMTCPHHFLIFNSKKRSYRDLPKRFSEQSRLYRYEKSGALSGLERVRTMLLTEGHIFIRKDQIIFEFKHLYKMIIEALEIFNINIDYISLSLRNSSDKEKFFPNDDLWNEAENDLRKVVKELGIKVKEMVGDAAFYGPKIDIQIKNALNHEITISTIQLDFLLPSRFNATFINKNNQKEQVVLVHRGLIGTYERFIGILLEQTKGILPFWLSPKQFVVIPVINHDKAIVNYADLVYRKLNENKFNVEFDGCDERLSRKIREAQISKVKYQVIIGKKEVQEKIVSIRAYGSKETKSMSLDQLITLGQKWTNEKK